MNVKPTLCYVTDRRSLGPAAASAGAGGLDPEIAPVAARIREAVQAGVDWVQIREKDLSARLLAALAGSAVAAARNTSARILINDRLDVALATGAHGVHLGAQSVPVEDVAHWRSTSHWTEGFLIGASCHSVEEAAAAEDSGADFVIFGPVFATPSKAAYGPSQGLERLAEVCGRVRIPAIAIGGITLENAADCREAGAAGFAAIRLFQQAADLAAVIAALRNLA